MIKKLHSFTISLFYFLLLATPFVFTWVNEELFEFNKMLFVYALTIVIMASWGVRMILEKRLILRATPLDVPIFLFLSSQVLATIFSIHPRTSFFGYYTRFNGGLFSTFTYISLFYAFVSNVQKKHLPGLFVTTLLSAFLVSLYSIPEHFGYSPSCALITQELGVDCWKQKVQERVFGTFGQPNWLAAYIISLIPLCMALSLTSKNIFSSIKSNISTKWIKYLSTVTTVMLFATLVFTKSRSGMIGLVAGLGLFFSVLLWIEWQKNKSLSSILQPIKNLKIEIISIVILTLLFGTPFSPSIKGIIYQFANVQLSNSQSTSELSPDTNVEQPTTPRTDLGGTESGDIRKIVWKGALDVWRRYPVFGSGVETFAYSYYQDRPVEHNLVSEWDFLYNKAHNEFINILATTGAVGLTSYLLFLGWYGFLSARFLIKKPSNIKKDKYYPQQVIILSLTSGITALLVSNFFGFSTVVVQVILFIFLGLFIITSTQETDATKSNDEPLHFTQYFGISIIAIAMLFFLSSIYAVWKADWHYAQGKALIKENKSTEGVAHLQKAITTSPDEALFYDDLSYAYASLAVAYADTDATASAELAQAALITSDYIQDLNNRHLNFYKTRARVLITLAQLDPSLLTQAKDTLTTALEYSPNDAKIMYNLALIESSLDNKEAAIATLEKTIELKSNYPTARFELGKIYEQTEQIDKAKEQYYFILNDMQIPSVEVKEKLDAIESQEK